LTYNSSVKKVITLLKFCYKFLFQFILHLLIGFGIYKEKIKDKNKSK